MDQTQSKKNIIIIGAGISGLTAAHLLLSSGCDVTLIEEADDIGGQAKSRYTRNNFPTEHSLRVVHDEYYYFYEILKSLQKNSCLDHEYNLVQFDLCSYYNDFLLFFKQNRHRSISLIKKPIVYSRLLLIMLKNGLKIRELILIFKLIFLWNCSSEKFIAEYDKLDTKTLLHLEGSSQSFFDTIFKIAQIGGAVQPSSSSILTLKLLKLGNAMINNIHTVKMFNGPNSESLFNPWKNYLQDCGVKIITKTKISTLKVVENYVLNCDSLETSYSGDFFILAVNYDNAKRILNNSGLLSTTDLNVNILDQCFQWSNGAQFYLSKLPTLQTFYPGLATVYSSSSWGLVTVIQGNGFWKKLGKVDKNLNILSVTFTNALSEGIIYHKPLIQCTREEIKDELLAQCGIVDKSIIIDWHLDDALQYISKDEFEKYKPSLLKSSYSQQNNNWLINSNMLFTPIPGYYSCAPQTETSLVNLYLAGEYCRTHYKVPTMEKACESGFHAANAILKKLNLPCFTAEINNKSNSFFSRLFHILNR